MAATGESSNSTSPPSESKGKQRMTQQEEEEYYQEKMIRVSNTQENKQTEAPATYDQARTGNALLPRPNGHLSQRVQENQSTSLKVPSASHKNPSRHSDENRPREPRKKSSKQLLTSEQLVRHRDNLREHIRDKEGIIHQAGMYGWRTWGAKLDQRRRGMKNSHFPINEEVDALDAHDKYLEALYHSAVEQLRYLEQKARATKAREAREDAMLAEYEAQLAAEKAAKRPSLWKRIKKALSFKKKKRNH